MSLFCRSFLKLLVLDWISSYVGSKLSKQLITVKCPSSCFTQAALFYIHCSHIMISVQVLSHPRHGSLETLSLSVGPLFTERNPVAFFSSAQHQWMIAELVRRKLFQYLAKSRPGTQTCSRTRGIGTRGMYYNARLIGQSYAQVKVSVLKYLFTCLDHCNNLQILCQRNIIFASGNAVLY